MGITEEYRGPSGRILPGTTLSADEIVRRLCRFFTEQREVLLAYLFGSYAKDEAKTGSDVDIAVLLDPSLQGEELYDVYRNLFLGIRGTINTERFDLVVLNRAPLALKFEIITQGRLIFAKKEEILNCFEMEVIRKFQDTAHLRKVQNQYLKERVYQWFSERKASAHG